MRKLTFIMPGISWSDSFFLISLPFSVNRRNPSFTTVHFETSQGFTTTGSSICPHWTVEVEPVCFGEALPTGSSKGNGDSCFYSGLYSDRFGKRADMRILAFAGGAWVSVSRFMLRREFCMLFTRGTDACSGWSCYSLVECRYLIVS